MIALASRPIRTIIEPMSPASDGSITIRTEADGLVQLNATAAALWALCDGKTTVQEIVTAARAFFSGSPEQLQSDILNSLDELTACGLLDVS